MVTANELLKSITNSEAEGHIVIGIDRRILVPAALKRIAVQYDHNVETVTFDCPRYWDNLDMSKMAIYVNYMRSDGYADSYPVTNITVDNNIMYFNWTISRNVTEVKGDIRFLVCVKKTDAEGNEVNHWNSELCQDMFVSEGMETEEQIMDLSSDLVTQLLLQMDASGKLYVGSGDMPAGYNIQIDPNGSAFELPEAERFANAFKGNVIGEIIRVDDVSPTEHDVECWVHSKNLFNGELKPGYVKNTLGELVNVGDPMYRTLGMNLKKGIYTVSLSANVNFIRILLNGIYYNSGPVSNAYTFTQEEDGYFAISFRLDPAVDWDDSVTVQLERGSVATEYEPYIDPSTILVSRCGKNLFPYPYDGTTYTNGITFTSVADGSIIVNGTNDGSSNSVFYIAQDAYITFPAGTYSCRPNISGIAIMGVEKGGGYFTFCTDNKRVFTLSEPKTFRSIYIQIAKGTTKNFPNIHIQPMLEYGGEQTRFAAGVKTNVTPNSDGTVEVTSISPTMTLFTDTPGVTIEAEYNKESEKAVEEAIESIDRAYELIESISVTEELTKINLTTEADGTPYNFKKLFMKYNLPQLSAATWFTFRVGSGDFSFGEYHGNASYETYYCFEAEVENGLISADISYHTNSYLNCSNGIWYGARNIRTTPIDRLVIEGTIPVGTTFEIWGVRA